MKGFNCENPAFDILYLEDVMKVHASLFREISRRGEYDIFSSIDAYMRYSEIRRKMDVGNWSALNKSYKQLYNSIDFSVCDKKGKWIDDYALEWMADIYTLLQWRYNIPSAEISEKIPAETLYRTFNPLHETSHKIACEKLYKKYLEPRQKEVEHDG